MNTDLLSLFDADEASVQAVLRETLKGADDGELFLEHAQAESLSFDNGRLKGGSFNTDQGFGLRAVAGEAVGYAHSGEMTLSALKRAADAAGAVTRGYSGDYADAPVGTNRRLPERFEVTHEPEGLVAVLQVLAGKVAQPLQRKRLDIVARQHAAVDDRLAEMLEGHAPVALKIEAGEVTRQAAREGVARAGRVVDVLQRIGGEPRGQIRLDRDAAQLAHFRDLRLNSDDAGIEAQVLRAQAENLTGPQARTDASEEAQGKERHQPPAFKAFDVFHQCPSLVRAQRFG